MIVALPPITSSSRRVRRLRSSCVRWIRRSSANEWLSCGFLAPPPPGSAALVARLRRFRRLILLHRRDQIGQSLENILLELLSGRARVALCKTRGGSQHSARRLLEHKLKGLDTGQFSGQIVGIAGQRLLLPA